MSDAANGWLPAFTNQSPGECLGSERDLDALKFHRARLA